MEIPGATKGITAQPRRSVAGSSQESPIEDIVMDSSCSSDDASYTSTMRSSLHYRLDRLVAVVPPVYVLGSNYSMRLFFDMLERYFRAKYLGGELECALELGHFLEGEALEAYNDFGGFRKGYSSMKAFLLEWYHCQGIHGTRHWRNELRSLRMKPEESLKLLTTRIQEVARTAYPANDVQCVEKMFDTLYRVTPQFFHYKLHERLVIKEVTGIRQGLTWNDVLKQAAQEDKLAKKKKGVSSKKTDFFTM